MENPFELIAHHLATLTGRIETINAAVQRLEDRMSHPLPEWEKIADAAKLRGVGRKRLIAAAMTGQVRCRRCAAPGAHLGYLLNVRDLDEHFPVIAKEKPQRRTTALGPGGTSTLSPESPVMRESL